MSNGDDETEADEDAPAADAGDGDAADETAISPDSLDERLTQVENTLEAAETEAILDEVEGRLDAIESDLEAADLPEPDEDDEDAEDPRADLEDRLADLRGRLEEKRGPYAEEVVEEVEAAASTVSDTRWTGDGLADLGDVVGTFLGTVADELGTTIEPDSDDADDLAAALSEAADAIESAGLDPDTDTETIEALVAAAGTLTEGLENAEEWSDLTVREQLDAEGFYDVLESENRKDFPPEWTAIKVHEKLGNPEPILLGLETFDSDFMEDNIMDSLVRMAPEEAFDAMHQRAQKRNKQPVEILGKIGDERATDTLHEFVDGDGDPALQTVTLRALGEIGSEESTQPVADRLVADNYEVRSASARALGLIGDTRAIEPLADVLENDEANEVRASAAWALNQIGTERALDVLADYADDQSYIVQTEAEKAV